MNSEVAEAVGGLMELPHPDVEVAGALDLEQTPDGVIPRRLPAWTVPQVPPEMHRSVRGSAGVRLRLWPSGDTVTLRLRCAVYHPTTAPVQRVDALRGDVATSAPLARVTELDEAGLPRTDAPFDDVVVRLPAGDGPVELWLPNGGVTEIAGLRAAGLRPLPVDPRPRWWHHGSSISQCSGAAGRWTPGPRWWPARPAST